MNQTKVKEIFISFIIKYSFVFVILFSLIAPFTVAHAAIDCKTASLTSASANLGTVLSYAVCVLSDLVVPLIFAIALVYFVWGVVQYYLNPENEEKRAKGKEFIIGGIIAMFVMISVWGLVGILTTTFGTNVKLLPGLPGQTN